MAPRRKRPRLEGSLRGEDGVEVHSADVAGPAASAPEPSSPKQSHHQARQLFVRSLPTTATSESLTEHFSQSYPLKHATVVLDPSTKQSKGYGFVTFTDADDAQRAREEFDRSLVEGKKIRVEVAESRHRDLEGAASAEGRSKATAAAASKAEREKQKLEARQPPPKLIIRNLPWTIQEPDQLSALFRSYGKVKHATIPKKKAGLMAGFGFVVLRGRKNAEKAMEGVNGKVVEGRTLAVDWAMEKSIWEGTQAEDAEPDQHVEAGEGKGLKEDARQSLTAGSIDGVDEIDVDYDDEEDDAGFDSSLDGSGEEIESEDEELSPGPPKIQDNSSTIFVRNVPFTGDDDLIFGHFGQFGPVRYARVVMDHITERPRGTAFVSFYNKDDADKCFREAPRIQQPPPQAGQTKTYDGAKPLIKHSLLENELSDPSGRYTLEGRVLQISKAVDKNEAVRLTEEGHSFRDRRDKDRRRLYLLSEGTIPSNTPLYETLAPSEVQMREASMKQRKTLIQSNPSLHLSLTRLSIRNVPRSVTSKDLKALAREAVVSFAKDVKAAKRQQLSKEESARGGEEMAAAEKARKARGKGIVKQAKIVFEGQEGGKVSEQSGAGRSRGYGFIEYTSHRWALMGLRWLNGHVVLPPNNRKEGKGARKPDGEERKKRLIVEFAIENAQVVARRKERETKARDKTTNTLKTTGKSQERPSGRDAGESSDKTTTVQRGWKRKRNENDKGPKTKANNLAKRPSSAPAAARRIASRPPGDAPNDKSQTIVTRKRMAKRTAKKQGRP